MKRTAVAGAASLANTHQHLVTALESLQHRGQLSVGMVVAERYEKGTDSEPPADGDEYFYSKRWGRGTFSQSRIDVNRLSVTPQTPRDGAGIGLITAGRPTLELVEEPMVMHTSAGKISIAFTGTLVNTARLRAEMESQGLAFIGDHPSEVIATLMASRMQREGSQPLKAIAAVLPHLQGGFAFTMIHNGALFAACGGGGIHPLSLAKIGDGGWVVASETSAFTLLEAEFIRHLNAGEVIHLKAGCEVESITTSNNAQTPCSRNWVYFARPDSWMVESRVIQSRRIAGMRLARAETEKADLVVPVPDSGRSSAAGFADVIGLPLVEGLHRNRYVQQISTVEGEKAKQALRRAAIMPVRGLVEGRSIFLVDDSMLAGHTMRRLVRMLKRVGANSVHVRISSPPVVRSCPFGLPMPDDDDLAANSGINLTDWIGADTLRFLAPEGLESAIGMTEPCFVCFGRGGAESSGVTNSIPLSAELQKMITDIEEEVV